MKYFQIKLLNFFRIYFIFKSFINKSKNKNKIKDEATNAGERFCSIQNRNIKLDWSDNVGLDCEEQSAVRGTCSKLECKWAKTNRFAYEIKGGTFSGVQIMRGEDISRKIAINTSKAKGIDPTKPIDQFDPMKKCAICGKEVDFGLNQCPHCGKGIFTYKKKENDVTKMSLVSLPKDIKVLKYCDAYKIRVTLVGYIKDNKQYGSDVYSNLSCSNLKCKFKCTHNPYVIPAIKTFLILNNEKLNAVGTFLIKHLERAGIKDYTK